MSQVTRGTWRGRYVGGVVVSFWDNVNKTDTCWLWLGNTNTDGYGMWGRESAHVASWMLANGRRPRKWEKIHHTCETSLCVRPDHLVALTPAQHKSIHRKNKGGSRVV